MALVEAKKLLLSTVALVALGAPALAADMAARPRYAKEPPPIAAPIYNWTGFYIGGHVGGAFNGSNGFGGTSDNCMAFRRSADRR